MGDELSARPTDLSPIPAAAEQVFDGYASRDDNRASASTPPRWQIERAADPHRRAVSLPSNPRWHGGENPTLLAI